MKAAEDKDAKDTLQLSMSIKATLSIILYWLKELSDQYSTTYSSNKHNPEQRTA